MDIVKNKDVSATGIDFLDEDVHQLMLGKQRLLMLNALFDAARAGESSRGIAENISLKDTDATKAFVQQLAENSKALEH